MRRTSYDVRSDLLQAVDDGWLTFGQLAEMAIRYMSVDDLEDMVRVNDVASAVLFPRWVEQE